MKGRFTLDQCLYLALKQLEYGDDVDGVDVQGTYEETSWMRSLLNVPHEQLHTWRNDEQLHLLLAGLMDVYEGQH